MRQILVKRFPLCLVVLLLPLLAGAAEPPKFDPFDKNKNGTLDPHEWEVFLIHAASDTHRRYDKDFDGQLGGAEVALIEADARKRLKVDRTTLEGAVRQVTVLTPDEARQAVPHTPTEPKPLLGGWRVRGEFERVGVLIEEEKTFAAMTSAQIGSTDDRVSGERALKLKGAVFYPWRPLATITARPGERLHFVDWGLAFGVDFDVDRLAKNEVGVTESKNLLRALMTVEQEWNGGSCGITQFYLRGSPFVATDSHFRSSQLGTEVEFQPSIPIWLFDGVATRWFGTDAATRLTWMAHFEMGRVIGDGGKKGLKSHTDFFRGGPKALLELLYLPKTLFPNCWQALAGRFRPSLAFQHLDGTGTGAHSTNLLEAKLGFKLDQMGHTALELSYTKGQKPLSSDDRIDSFGLTTGIKF